VLADPQRHLSKRHCTIAFRDSFWEVTDLSTNGTFLNAEREPIGHGEARDLRDGDRLRLGSYQIAIAIAEAAPARHGPLSQRDVPDLDEPNLDGPDFDQPEFGRPELGGRKREMRGIDSSGIDPFDGPPQPDHSPEIEDAFVPPRPVVLLGEDWDLGEPAPPLVLPLAPPLAAETVPPRPVPGHLPEPGLRPAGGAVEAGGLMTAFLRGAGLQDAQPADSVAAMEELGSAFRAFVGGLRETLVARAAVKSEFRIEQTMIRARGNNPLKFAASDDDALLALVGAGRRSDVGPAAAVSEAFRDIKLHELATMAAMQTAVRGLLRDLAPEKMRDGAGSGLLPPQRKARAWDTYEAAHARLTQALSDNFDSAFGRAFARAYEQALRETRP
jgi:type VI secretion system protein ImpI/type VI secretion system protein